jgi:hypothetical protein
VLLTWDGREDVNTYYIYRKEAEADKGAVYLGGTNDTYYIDGASLSNGLADGKKYEYFVSVSNGGPASSSSVTMGTPVSVPGPGSEIDFPDIKAESISLQPYSTQTGTDPKNNAIIVSLPADPLFVYQVKVERRATGTADWLSATTLGSRTVYYEDAVVNGVYTGTIKTNISSLRDNYNYYVLGEVGYEYRVAVYYGGVNSGLGYKVPAHPAKDGNGADFIATKPL